jgi:hypothetical protein
MAFFAKLDSNNLVTEVNVIDDSDVNFLTFPASEPIGIQYLTQWSGGYTNWKQTSEIGAYRKHYAGTNYVYDATLDAFIPPKPYPSWLLDTINCVWTPPTPYPTDGKQYVWDESTLSWKEVTE